MFMAMRNPFAKPQTSGWWLVHSICWTAGALLIWLLLFLLVRFLCNPLHLDGEATKLIFFSSFWLPHLIIWWQALSGGIARVNSSEVSAPMVRIAAISWLVLLFVRQMLALLIGFVGTILSLSCVQGSCID
jgi:hypothetical protein